MAMRLFFLEYFFWFFGFSSRYNFQHFFCIRPTMLQWLQLLLRYIHQCVITVIFFSFPFQEALWCSFYFDLVVFPYFILLLCLYIIPILRYGFKQHLFLALMVLYNPHILEKHVWFFVEILKIISIFLNFVVYSYTLSTYIYPR